MRWREWLLDMFTYEEMQAKIIKLISIKLTEVWWYFITLVKKITRLENNNKISISYIGQTI